MKTPNLDSLASKTPVKTDDLIIPDFAKSLGSIPIFGESKNKISSLLTIDKDIFYSKLQQENQIFSKLYVKEDEKSAFPLDIKEQLYDLYSNILKDLNLNTDIENVLSVMGSEANKELLENITYLQDIIKQNVIVYNNNAEKFKGIIELQNEENQALLSRLGQEGLNVLEKIQTPIVKRLIDENMKQDRLLLKETEEKLKNNEGIGWLLGLLAIFGKIGKVIDDIKKYLEELEKRLKKQENINRRVQPCEDKKKNNEEEEKNKREKQKSSGNDEEEKENKKPEKGSKFWNVLSEVVSKGKKIGKGAMLLNPTEFGKEGQGEEQSKESISTDDFRNPDTLKKLWGKEQPSATNSSTNKKDTNDSSNIKEDFKQPKDKTPTPNLDEVKEVLRDYNKKQQPKDKENIKEVPSYNNVNLDDVKQTLREHNEKQKKQENDKQSEDTEETDTVQPKKAQVEEKSQSIPEVVLPTQEQKSEDTENQPSKDTEETAQNTIVQEHNIFAVNSNNNSISNNTNNSNPLAISSYTSKLIQALA
jgi:hypothetical protein